jgi:hypothetical protein
VGIFPSGVVTGTSILMPMAGQKRIRLGHLSEMLEYIEEEVGMIRR